MTTRFQIARFNIATGPVSLFERVKFKLRVRRELKLNGKHLQDRASERNAPLDKFRFFDPSEWLLKMAEVRIDTGRFVSSVWEVDIDCQKWWVVIGLHDTIKSVYPVTNKTGFNSQIVTEGSMFDFVEKVNRDLMRIENF